MPDAAASASAQTIRRAAARDPGAFGFGAFDNHDPRPPDGAANTSIEHAAVTLQVFAPGMTKPLETVQRGPFVGGPRQTIDLEPPGRTAPDSPWNRVGW